MGSVGGVDKVAERREGRAGEDSPLQLVVVSSRLYSN